MSRSLAAGACAFLIVFAAGFLLGTIRVLVLEPRAGPVAATLIELPVMLTISWLTTLAMIVRFKVEATPGARLVMGLAAFSLLIGAELMLGLTLFDRTFADQLAAWRSMAGALGLAAQIFFAAMPLIALTRRQIR